MRISGAYPSDFIKAADLQGRQVTVTIERVEMRDIGDDHKPVLYFEGKERGLVLNKTNSNTIAALYGDETDDWVGQPVVLFEAQVDYQGRQVAAIRVRVPPRPRQPARTQETTPPPSLPQDRAPNNGGGFPVDDEIPF